MSLSITESSQMNDEDDDDEDNDDDDDDKSGVKDAAEGDTSVLCCVPSPSVTCALDLPSCWPRLVAMTTTTLVV